MSNTSSDVPLLQVKHLSLSFTHYGKGFRRKQTPVIQDLNLTVPAGQILAVVGASGSGKSLLAQAVLGILPGGSTLRGELLYQGEPLTPHLQKKLRGKEMVLVPQSVSSLDPLMKIGPQLQGALRGSGAKERSRQILSRYGLAPSVEDAYPFQLSGGMARRVLIGTAVMGTPRLVIADEPTPGLHIGAAKRVLSHFREIANGGAGVLLITHDLELALEVADRISVFYAGTTLEECSPHDFQHQETLRHPYTKALWRATPSNGFHSFSGGQTTGAGWIGCPFLPHCSHARDACSRSIPWRQVRGGYVRCLREDFT